MVPPLFPTTNGPMDRHAIRSRLNRIKMLLADSSMDEETRAQLESLGVAFEELLAVSR